MPLDLLFWIANLIALAGWIALILSPPGPGRLVSLARIAGAALALAYTLLFLTSAREAAVLAEDYSLDGIAAFFAVPELRLLGWVHYLAFDLWVGSWEVEEAGRRSVPRPLLILCLLLTYMVGPFGLLAFLVASWACRRRAESPAAP